MIRTFWLIITFNNSDVHYSHYKLLSISGIIIIIIIIESQFYSGHLIRTFQLIITFNNPYVHYSDCGTISIEGILLIERQFYSFLQVKHVQSLVLFLITYLNVVLCEFFLSQFLHDEFYLKNPNIWKEKKYEVKKEYTCMQTLTELFYTISFKIYALYLNVKLISLTSINLFHPLEFSLVKS